jgi:hypothetical protein
MKECDKIRGLFGSYIYGGMTPGERTAVDNHIKDCEKCASELQSLQKILEKVESDPQMDDVPQRMHNDFTRNVYKRIASDVLRRRSKQIFLRKFVLSPSLAGVVLAVVIAVFRFHPGLVTVSESSHTTVLTDETSKKELRASLAVKEFFGREGTPRESETSYIGMREAPLTEPSSSDLDRLVQDLPDSERLLQSADFINYSMGDRRRALAEYQRLVDYYPETDAAMEAKERIRVIRGVEYNIQIEKADVEQPTDTGI